MIRFKQWLYVGSAVKICDKSYESVNKALSLQRDRRENHSKQAAAIFSGINSAYLECAGGFPNLILTLMQRFESDNVRRDAANFIIASFVKD